MDLRKPEEEYFCARGWTNPIIFGFAQSDLPVGQGVQGVGSSNLSGRAISKTALWRAGAAASTLQFTIRSPPGISAGRRGPPVMAQRRNASTSRPLPSIKRQAVLPKKR